MTETKTIKTKENITNGGVSKEVWHDGLVALSEDGTPHEIPVDNDGKIASSATTSTPINVTISGDSEPFWSSSSASYEAVAYVMFPGSDVFGTISSIKTQAINNTSTLFNVKIYDVTNSQTIAELTGSANTDGGAFVDMGTISNIPTGPAVFEVEVSRTGGGADTMFIGGIIINP